MLEWIKENRSEKDDYWAIGKNQFGEQYTILEGVLCYILKISFLNGDNMREIGRFSTLDKAKKVAELIDEG